MNRKTKTKTVQLRLKLSYTALRFNPARLWGVENVVKGGAFFAPITIVHPAMGAEIITVAFVVVVIGGLGSIGGSMAGSLIVGAAQTWGAYYLPETAMVIMYAVMGAILIFRPWGLFGEEE